MVEFGYDLLSSSFWLDLLVWLAAYALFIHGKNAFAFLDEDSET
jgi:succinate dehydrogenase/fumarate reductase cytochrome b subunit